MKYFKYGKISVMSSTMIFWMKPSMIFLNFFESNTTIQPIYFPSNILWPSLAEGNEIIKKKIFEDLKEFSSSSNTI